MELFLKENIKKYRKEKGLTQEQLAEEIGVTVSTVSKWEGGSVCPDIGTIAELADLFEISVDVLLGYCFKKCSAGQYVEKLKGLRCERSYEEGVAVAQEALKRFPNNFSVVYESGQLLYLAAFERANNINESQLDKIKSEMELAGKALEHSLALLPQNTDKCISKEMIHQQIGCIIGITEDKRKAIAYLEEHNVFHINDQMISAFLADLGAYEEAWQYAGKAFQRSMIDLWNSYQTIYNILINEKKYNKALSVSEWMVQACLSLAKPGNSYYIRACAIAESMIATLYAYKEQKEGRSYEKEISNALKKAFEYAQEFDQSPEYCGRMKFLDCDGEAIQDSFGETAAIALKNMILCSRDDEKQFARLRKIYNQVSKNMGLKDRIDENEA